MQGIEKYIPLVEFLGTALGKNYEVVLHDLTQPEHSIVAIANGELSNRKLGDSVTDFVLKALQQKERLEHRTYLTKYHGKDLNGHICLSSSYFIHNDRRQTIGVLCINQNITPYLQARKFLTEELIQDGPETKPLTLAYDKLSSSVLQAQPDLAEASVATEEAPIQFFENFQGSISEVITTLIDNALRKYQVAPQRLSLAEKMLIVQDLNENGLFLLKGGIPALAQRLQVSEPTVYRYLSRIKKDN